MNVRLAVRKNDTRIMAKCIHWFTGSIYSHCELEVDGICYSSSALDGGVRSKVIDLKPESWDIIDLPWAKGQAIVDHFVKTDHYRYGWIGLLTSQLFNLGRVPKRTTFCSQWCIEALSLPNPPIYQPHAVLYLCQHINELTDGSYTGVTE